MKNPREESLFRLAKQQPDAERPAFLNAVCGDDTELRNRIESLLKADDEQSGFLADDAPTETSATLLDESALTEETGSQIGRYKLLEKLGEGGFGSVWAAEQKEPVRRRVALKIIKLGMDTKQVVARFEAERQALALMDHPNIAKVLDAGATDTGRPYFVMELVKGVPITKYCEQEKLDTNGRLDLFIKVCQAIQHAHQKGIIHRDIKPSNIMVTLHDGVPVPKVIDFGIAKATQQELTEKTIYTQYSQFIGTPAYMSPEQAEMSGLDIDTRSDIYSLGVLLYELLTGTTPFDTKELMQSGLDEMRKIIREREPAKPSTRLSQTLSKNPERSTSNSQLPTLPSDLDWIAMKCLEKDRTRRYDTANGLSMDLKRHLSNEPITARPPSAGYKFEQFAKRNRAALVTAVGFVALVIVGAIISGTFAVRESAARREAEAFQKQERLLNFRMAFDRGIGLCEDGKVGSGMLWLARALELAPDDQQAMERVIRANLNAWSRELHSMISVFPIDQAAMSAAYSPDHTLVVGGTFSGTIQMWDRETGEPIGAPLRHENVVHEIHFTEDGRHFLTSSYDGDVKIWETESKRLVRTFEHDSEVYGLCLLPNDQFATSTRNGVVSIWELEGEKPAFQFPIASHAAHDISLSPDRKRLIVSNHNGEAMILDLESKKVVAKFIHKTRVPTATFATLDGSRVVTGDADGTVKLWEYDEGDSISIGREIGERWKHRGVVHRIRLSPDGTKLLTASFDNNAQLLDPQTGRPIGVPFEHQSAVEAVEWSNDGHVLTTCDDNIIREWSPAPGSLLRTLAHENPGLGEVNYTSDARYALTWKDKQTGIVYRTDTGAQVGAPIPFGGGTYRFAISHDETRLIAGAKSTVRIWNLQTGQPIGEGFPQSGQVSVAVNTDGRHMLSGGFGGVIQKWDVNEGLPLGRVYLSPGNSVRGVAFSPANNSIIAAVFDDKRGRLINADTGDVLKTFDGHLGITMGVSFSPDGKLIATGSFDNTIRVWDVESGETVAGPLKHDGPFWYQANFHPDGDLIVTACDDGTARVWDIETGKTIGPKLKNEVAMRAAAFTAGGTQIVTGTASGTTRFWSIPTRPLTAEADHIQLWLEVSTGLELSPATGEINSIDAGDWKTRREELTKRGGPPVS